MTQFNTVLNCAIDAAFEVVKHTPQTLPLETVNRVQLRALIDILEATDDAILNAQEIQDSSNENGYIRELARNYAANQVDVQINLNALKVDVKEVFTA